MAQIVDFNNVSMDGVESSPHAQALAGLRANEARYFKNKYNHDFAVTAASENPAIITYVNAILKERDIIIAAKPLQVSQFEVEGVQWTYVFYEDGLSINVLYTIEDTGKRAVGFKLSDGMEIPKELSEKFKFVRQKSKLAGTIRGSYFMIKGKY